MRSAKNAIALLMKPQGRCPNGSRRDSLAERPLAGTATECPVKMTVLHSYTAAVGACHPGAAGHAELRELATKLRTDVEAWLRKNHHGLI
jgi:hypothetical protein